MPVGWPLWVQDGPVVVASTPFSRFAGGCLKVVVGLFVFGVVVLVALVIVGEAVRH